MSAGSAALGLAGPLIGGAFGLIGQHQQEIENQRSRDENARQAEKNATLQKEFAQQGLRWKVEDAKAAGLHPLAALGAQTFNAHPVHMGDSPSDKQTVFRDMGQNFARAINATSTTDERFSARMQALQVEHGELENTMLRSQIALMGNPPPFPDGTPKGSPPGSPAVQSESVPDIGYARTPQGGLAIVPSKMVKELTEDSFVPETMWALRNQLIPNFSPDSFEPDPRYFPLPEGFTRWAWSLKHQAYMPAGRRSTLQDAIPEYPNTWGR